MVGMDGEYKYFESSRYGAKIVKSVTRFIIIMLYFGFCLPRVYARHGVHEIRVTADVYRYTRAA